MFHLFDTDGNGMITLKELRENFKTKVLQSDSESEDFMLDVMNEVDLNKDGQISFEEFNTALKAYLLHSVEK